MTPVSHCLDGQVFHWGEMKHLRVNLLGEHQQHNAAVVLTTIARLRDKGWNITDEQIRTGLDTANWPGRFQVVRKEPLFVVDGGHNPQCMAALVKNIEDYLKEYDLTVLTGVMADKDRSTMYPPLLSYANQFVTVTPDNPRALAADDLAAYLRNLGAEAEAHDAVADGVAAAISHARKTGGAVLACGSLYMVGEIVEAVRNAL